MNDLEQFIYDTFKTTKIEKIPTQSRRATLAKKAINKIISNHPEWFCLIVSLVCYPTQKWAIETRKKLKIDIRTMKNEILQEKSDYFGLKPKKIEENIEMLNNTNKIIEFIENILNTNIEGVNLKVINAVHNYNHPDVSTFIFNQYYEQSLIKICEKYNSKFTKLAKPLNIEYTNMDDEHQFAYHNTKLLIDIKQKLYKYTNVDYVMDEIDYNKTIKVIDDCINSLKTYINDADELATIVMYFSKGYSEKKIMSLTGKSRTYARNRYMEGIHALSYLIWGYSTKDILENIK